MAYKVQIAITRPAENPDIDMLGTLGMESADATAIPALIESTGGSVEYTRSADNLTTYAVYTYSDRDAWLNFYNQALPVWNRNNTVEKANNAGVTIDVSVVENT